MVATPQTLDYTAITEAQRDCPSIQAAGDSSITSQLIPFGNIRVLCDTSSRYLRQIIHLGHCRQVLDAFHGVSQPWAGATRRIMTERVVWPCMKKDVTEWVKDCQACDRAKVTSQPATAMQPIPVPQQRSSHIHVDIVGQLPTSKEGFRYLITIIDRSSRMLEVVPITNIETESCRD